VASEASILLASSREIGLLGADCSTFEAPVRNLPRLFGQSRKRGSRKSISNILHIPAPIRGPEAVHQIVKHRSQHYV
jgi:hypothetical protein